MSAHWHIGMEVECIFGKATSARCDMPVKGARYVISEILEFSNGVSLQMTTLHWAGDEWFYPGYRADLFRPVTKRSTDISIFTQMLNPSKVDA